ncbi:MAG: helix-hairpin-helix domain-containing protein [Candidatus Azobacteroides sp.]|nr:helix-hairpin-helix domain-containing protein [Candidatus Azobacteroides sp.]
MWKDFFYFSRRERQGILLLIVFIGGVLAGKFFFSSSKSNLQPVEKEAFAEKMDGENASPETREEAYTPLFRSKPKENRKTYYHLPSQPSPKTYYVREKDSLAPAVPKNYPKTEKLPVGSMIELNTADSLDLMKIPGIGSSFAKRIIAYRKLLGGYHRIEQLQEVYGMYEELYDRIIPYLSVDPNQIIRIQVNTSSLDKLKAHPYINFYQAKAILEMRKKKGKLTGIDELKLLEEFTPEDWVRIAPYLEF